MKKCMFNKLVYIKTSKVMKNYEIQNMKLQMKKSITPADVTTGSELYTMQEILELDFQVGQIVELDSKVRL